MNHDNMKELQDYYVSLIQKDLEANKASHFKSMEYLKTSTAKYHGEVIYSLFIPKVFTENTVKMLDQAVNTMYSILEKVIAEYLNNKSYRELFGFDQRLEELLLVDRGYDSLLPICRLDIFLNEEDLSFKFCEFNADGTSSMNEDRELNIALTFTAAYNKLKEAYALETFELFDSWVEEFIAIYSTYKRRVEQPHICIVDFLEKGSSLEEFNQFKLSFEKAGYSSEVCEIRNLRYENGALYSPSGKKIDAIYRRAVTSDIMENIEYVSDFVQAVKDGKVCLVGNFNTQIIHNKILFKLLYNQMTLNLLTDDEKDFVYKHIPFTARLDRKECNIDEIISNKDKWIIKPEDSYGAKGVFSGRYFSSEEWSKIVLDNENNHYLVQEFVTPYRTLNIDFNKPEPEIEFYSNLTGMYVYNGKLKGIYSRQSKKEIISTQYDENVIASFVAKSKYENTDNL